MPSPTPMTTHAPERVEVRTEPSADDERPAQILWRSRLWLVQHAVRLKCGPDQDERWQLHVGQGPDGRTDVVELVRLAGGGWQLHEDGA